MAVSIAGSVGMVQKKVRDGLVQRPVASEVDINRYTINVPRVARLVREDLLMTPHLMRLRTTTSWRMKP